MKLNSLVHAASLFVEHEPVAADQVAGGHPHTGVGRLGMFAGLEVGVWEMTPGVMRDVEADEVFVVLSGRGRILLPDGSVLELAPGTVGRLLAGEQTRWEIDEPLRKVWVSAHDR